MTDEVLAASHPSEAQKGDKTGVNRTADDVLKLKNHYLIKIP